MTACAESIGSVEPPELSPAPSYLLEECEAPVELPKKTLTQSEVEIYWIRDRSSLIECSDKKIGLQSFYINRDGLIKGNDE